jgi:hypothetical protein
VRDLEQPAILIEALRLGCCTNWCKNTAAQPTYQRRIDIFVNSFILYRLQYEAGTFNQYCKIHILAD